MPDDDLGNKLKACKKLKKNVLLNTLFHLYYSPPLPNWKVHRRNYITILPVSFSLIANTSNYFL